MPFFSVIIPTYNRRDLLQKALESVRLQTFPDYEVIVVDDGSNDGTWEELQKTDMHISALRQKNAGPGAARNLAARQAAGEHLVFLDSDDILTPWALETFHQAILNHNQVSHIIGQTLVIKSPSDFSASQLKRDIYQDEYSSDFLKCPQGNQIWASGIAVIQRQCFESAGGFDEGIHCHEDQDLSLKLACFPGFVRVLSPITTCILLTDNSLSRGNISGIYQGISLIIRREQDNLYPGGKARQSERRAYISVNVRNQSLMFIRNGAYKAGWSLYRKTFGWHLKLKRFRYLCGFPMLSLRDWFRIFCKTK